VAPSGDKHAQLQTLSFTKATKLFPHVQTK